VIVVHTLDRLGRTVRDTLNLIHELAERGVGIRDLADPIKVDSSDPADPMAKLAVVLLALFAQMERTYMLERAAHARAVATAKGRRIGRPVLVDADKLAYAAHLRDTGHTVAEIVAKSGIARTSLYLAPATTTPGAAHRRRADPPGRPADRRSAAGPGRWGLLGGAVACCRRYTTANAPDGKRVRSVRDSRRPSMTPWNSWSPDPPIQGPMTRRYSSTASSWASDRMNVIPPWANTGPSGLRRSRASSSRVSPAQIWTGRHWVSRLVRLRLKTAFGMRFIGSAKISVDPGQYADID